MMLVEMGWVGCRYVISSCDGTKITATFLKLENVPYRYHPGVTQRTMKEMIVHWLPPRRHIYMLYALPVNQEGSLHIPDHAQRNNYDRAGSQEMDPPTSCRRGYLQQM
jgi:hypothetical protein